MTVDFAFTTQEVAGRRRRYRNEKIHNSAFHQILQRRLRTNRQNGSYYTRGRKWEIINLGNILFVISEGKIVADNNKINCEIESSEFLSF